MGTEMDTTMFRSSCNYCRRRLLEQENGSDDGRCGEAKRPRLDKEDACPACLNLFRLEKICEAVRDSIQESEMELDSCQLQFSVPTLIQLRHLAFQHYLNVQPRLTVKKYLHCILSEELRKSVLPKNCEVKSGAETLGEDSLVTIRVIWDHPEDKAECRRIREFLEDNSASDHNKSSTKANKSQKKRLKLGNVAVGRNDLLSAFESGMLKIDDVISWPLCDLSPVTFSVMVLREPVFLAGRYLKYSRTLPQTPWLVEGERKMDSSLEELIEAPLREMVKCDSIIFSSSGREDCDVRMLGNGRPFAMEIHNLKSLAPLRNRLDSLANVIHSKSNKKIEVLRLKLISKSDLSILHKGEGKVKGYLALCRVHDGFDVSPEKLAELSKISDLVIEQKTPLRVLHRRTNMIRRRTIYSMKAERIPDVNRPHSFFRLRLRTEAGTYIKEFVHGDLGRTTPTVSSLLGIPVDIVALDCDEVKMDWPPSC